MSRNHFPHQGAFPFLKGAFAILGLALTLAPSCLAQDSPANAVEASTSLPGTSLPDVPLPDEPLPDAPGLMLGSQSTGTQAQTPAGAGSVSTAPTFHQRSKAYLYDLLGPGAFLGPAISAGVDQARPLKVGYPTDGFPGPGLHPAHGDVPEWGEGFEGYSKRYADRFGQGLLNTTLRYGLGEALHQDVTYHRCACTGALPRATHAFVAVFVAHTGSGRAVPSLPALASPFLASRIAVAGWYPSRYDSSDALRISLSLLISAPAKNLLAEFRKR